jgi:fructokinase
LYRSNVLHPLRSQRPSSSLSPLWDLHYLGNARRPALWRDPEQGLSIARQPLDIADICKMNAVELVLLTGESDPMRGLLALPERIALALVTLGAAGCLARWHEMIFAASAPAVGEAIDATGAGDAFVAALLASLLPHLDDLASADLTSALQRACRAGAFAVTRRGAMAALPSAADLDA